MDSGCSFLELLPVGAQARRAAYLDTPSVAELLKAKKPVVMNVDQDSDQDFGMSWYCLLATDKCMHHRQGQ